MRQLVHPYRRREASARFRPRAVLHLSGTGRHGIRATAEEGRRADGAVGWLVRQGDALAWLSLYPPDHPGHVLKARVGGYPREGALDAIPAEALWPLLLDVGLHTPPHERPLSDLIAEVREAWGEPPPTAAELAR